MIKRYLLVLSSPSSSVRSGDDDNRNRRSNDANNNGTNPEAIDRISKWIFSNRVSLAASCTILTTPTISNRIEAMEDILESTANASDVRLDVEILKDVLTNPLDSVGLTGRANDDNDGDGNNDERDSGNIDSPSVVDQMSDLLAVSRILSSPRDFIGVVYFSDMTALSTMTNPIMFNNLTRTCDLCSIPMALNESTATLCLQASTTLRPLAVLLFNPVAGQRPAATDLKEIHKILGPTYSIKVVYTEKALDIAEQAAGVVAWIQKHKERYQQVIGDLDGYTEPLLIASGGDGTVSAIAGATMNTGITVGVIPRGTANAFSVALGIPTDVAGACQNILMGQPRKVDGATVTLPSHVLPVDDEEGNASNEGDSTGITIAWINHAGVGFEAGLVDNTTRELKDTFGVLGYSIGAAKQLLSQQPFECTFQIDDETEKTVTTTVCTIGNVDPPSSIFAQGFGNVIPDDGLFEVTIGVAKGALSSLEGLAALAINTVVKESVGSDSLLCFRCKKIRLACSPAQKMLMDGEVIEIDEHPVVFECIPNGLKVLVPLPGGNGE